MTDDEVDRFILEVEQMIAKWTVKLAEIKAMRDRRDERRCYLAAFHEGWIPSHDDPMH